MRIAIIGQSPFAAEVYRYTSCFYKQFLFIIFFQQRSFSTTKMPVYFAVRELRAFQGKRNFLNYYLGQMAEIFSILEHPVYYQLCSLVCRLCNNFYFSSVFPSMLFFVSLILLHVFILVYSLVFVLVECIMCNTNIFFSFFDSLL